jgi:hypothetical protein
MGANCKSCKPDGLIINFVFLPKNTNRFLRLTSGQNFDRKRQYHVSTNHTMRQQQKYKIYIKKLKEERKRILRVGSTTSSNFIFFSIFYCKRVNRRVLQYN